MLSKINNLWLKIIALGLAIVTWYYVNGELTRKSAGTDRSNQEFQEEKP